MVKLGYSMLNAQLNLHSGRQLRKALRSVEERVTRTKRNLESLISILEWNSTHDLGYFRVSEHVVPMALDDTPSSMLHVLGLCTSECYRVRQLVSEGEVMLTVSIPKWQDASFERIEALGELLERLTYGNGVIEVHLGAPESLCKACETVARQLCGLKHSDKIVLVNDAHWGPEQTVFLCAKLGFRMLYDFYGHRKYLVAQDNIYSYKSSCVVPILESLGALWGQYNKRLVRITSTDESTDWRTYDWCRKRMWTAGGDYLVDIVAQDPATSVVELQALTRVKRPAWAHKNQYGRYV